MEPAPDRAAPPDRAGPLRQDQKDRLECILGIVRVTQHVLTDAEHHRPVPLDQGRERPFFPPGCESSQQRFIRQGTDRPRLEERLQEFQSVR